MDQKGKERTGIVRCLQDGMSCANNNKNEPRKIRIEKVGGADFTAKLKFYLILFHWGPGLVFSKPMLYA